MKTAKQVRVDKNTIGIGVTVDPDGIADHLVRCSILRIVMLADIEANLRH